MIKSYVDFELAHLRFNQFTSKMIEIACLSNQAIHALTKENSNFQPVYVQVIEFQQKKDKYYLILSDGFHMIKALPRHSDILDPEKDLNAIICIKRFMISKNVVGILQFQKVFNYKAKIGDPQEYNFNAINPQNVETLKLQKQLIDLKIDNTKQQKTAPKQPQIASQPATTKKQLLSKQLETQRKFIPPVINIPLVGSLKDYQTIKDLWIGMSRWTIICRIVQLEYNQFVSKKSGKDTKVLNIELIDRTGMKISGAFFGQAALQFKDYLVKDRVYKISQGQIRSESYNNSKNQKISPYKLVFTSLSLFQQVSDTNSIAKKEDAAITLGDCIERRTINQQFDIICILVNIEGAVEVKKDDRILKKTNLLVADPIKKITLYAVVWNQNIVLDHSLVGKAIILSRFKLSEYKNSLNLTSIYKSNIVPVQSHHYQIQERKTMDEYTSYQKLNQIKSDNQADYEVCSSIVELQKKISRFANDEWARADLIVYINRFSLKKWHYDGCPHCSKAAQNFSNCQHCHKYVEKTVRHFILGVEVCDATGSMWTVAYDQWAKKIFGVTDQTQVIDSFVKLDPNQLKEQTQYYLYQEYKLRISSKKDNEGRIKHNVSKIYERNLAQETAKNIQLINKLSLR